MKLVFLSTIIAISVNSCNEITVRPVNTLEDCKRVGFAECYEIQEDGSVVFHPRSKL